MTQWLLSIVGMVFVGIILEVIMPSGKTNSFIKMLFSVFLLYVIVSPLPNLFNKNFNLSNNTSTVLNTNYLIKLNISKIDALENDLVKILEEDGFLNVSIIVNANIYKEQFTPTKVHVDLFNLVLKNKDKHININKEITKIIRQFISINEEDIIFYGRPESV